MKSKFLVEKLLAHAQSHHLFDKFRDAYVRSGSINQAMREARHYQPTYNFSPVIYNASVVTPTPSSSPTPIPKLIIPPSYTSNRELHGNPTVGIQKEKKKKKPKNGNSKIIYEIIPRERYTQLSTLLMDYYHLNEPMSVALGMDLDETNGVFTTFLRMSLFASFVDVSVLAVDETAKRRVGALASIIVDPANTNQPNFNDYMSPKTHPVSLQMYEFFDFIEKDIDKTKEAGIRGDQEPRRLEHLYICTAPEYSGQGIGQKLVELSESVASNIINCQLAYAVATSEYSYQLFSSLGYHTIKEVSYANYENSKGEKIFADKVEQMKPHHACRAVIKKLKNYYSRQF